jgi:hypothetical protein
MPKIIFKWFLNVFAILFLNICVLAQNESNDSLQIADSLSDSIFEFNFFMIDLTYTNNRAITKDQSSENIPAFISDFSFLHKKGIYTGINYTNYINTDTSSYDLDFSLGYQNVFFNNIVDIDLSYTYHKYTGVDDYKGIDYTQKVNLNTGFTYQMMYLYADGDFYVDNKNYFTEFGVSNVLDFDDFLIKDDFLLIQPTVSFTYGTDYWLYNVYESYINNILLPILKFRGYQTVNISTEDVVEKYLNNNGLSTNTYSYQGVDFVIPVTYGIGSVSFSLAWMYSIPSDKLKSFGIKEQSGYYASLSFIF